MDRMGTSCVHSCHGMDSDLTAFRLSIWHLNRFRVGENMHHPWNWRGMTTPLWRVFWNHEPGAGVVYDGTDCPLAPDMVLAISPRTPIDMYITGTVDHMAIHAMPGYPCDRARQGVWRIPVANLPTHLLDEILPGPDPDHRMNRSRHLDVQETLATHAFVCSVLCSLPKDIWMPPPTDRRIRALAEEISSHPERPYRAEAMAKGCRMSVSTLSRRFREQVGQTPQQLITDCRLQKACSLLTHTDYSIDRIAEACGYCDRYHFSKLFKAHYLCGPASYRKHPTPLRTSAQQEIKTRA